MPTPPSNKKQNSSQPYSNYAENGLNDCGSSGRFTFPFLFTINSNITCITLNISSIYHKSGEMSRIGENPLSICSVSVLLFVLS